MALSHYLMNSDEVFCDSNMHGIYHVAYSFYGAFSTLHVNLTELFLLILNVLE